MNTKIRIITVLLASLFLISGLTMTYFATDGSLTNPEQPVDPAPVDPPVDPAPVDPPVDPTPTSSPEPQPTSAPESPTAAPTDAPVIDTPDSGNEQPGYINDPNSNDYYPGDYSSNGEDNADSVTGNTDLWKPSVDNKDLEESEWTNIVLDTSNTNTNAADFSAIKKNSATNSTMSTTYLVLGIVLILMSVAGFVYYGCATSAYKKKLKRLNAREQKHRDSHNAQRDRRDYGEDDYPTQADYNKRYQNRYSSTPYQSKRASKFDTADIPVKKYKSRH